jgi:hypothetical protein
MGPTLTVKHTVYTKIQPLYKGAIVSREHNSPSEMLMPPDEVIKLEFDSKTSKQKENSAHV